MLQAGEYQVSTLQNAAVAVGDGVIIKPVSASNGSRTTLTAQIQGVTTAAVTWEASLDGVNYRGFLMAPTTTGTGALTATADGIYRGDVTGFLFVRARISAWTAGTITITSVLTAV